MYEFVAILAGVPVALLGRQIENQRMRTGAVIALSLVIGFAVAGLAGELSENIGFGFFDALQVAAGAVVTLVVVARLRIGELR